MPKVGRTRSRGITTSSLLKTPLLSPKENLSNNNDKNKDDSNNNSNEDSKTAALSRGQRKRQAKRDQYLKREKMILSSLKLAEMEDQKNRIDGLDAIKEALTQTIKENRARAEGGKDNNGGQEEGESEGGIILKSNKSKKDVAQKEIPHLNLVLQHPSFKSNPFATMQQHLRNTLADQAKEQEVVARKERSEEEKKVKEKKELKKERIRNAKYEKGRKQRRRRN